MRIENWELVTNSDGYRAPEISTSSLRGNVYGHGRFQDGELIRTTHIVSYEGRKVFTFSGGEYELGEPSARYLAYLDGIGHVLDEKEPIKICRIGRIKR